MEGRQRGEPSDMFINTGCITLQIKWWRELHKEWRGEGLHMLFMIQYDCNNWMVNLITMTVVL